MAKMDFPATKDGLPDGERRISRRRKVNSPVAKGGFPGGERRIACLGGGGSPNLFRAFLHPPILPSRRSNSRRGIDSNPNPVQMEFSARLSLFFRYFQMKSERFLQIIVTFAKINEEQNS